MWRKGNTFVKRSGRGNAFVKRSALFTQCKELGIDNVYLHGRVRPAERLNGKIVKKRTRSAPTTMGKMRRLIQATGLWPFA